MKNKISFSFLITDILLITISLLIGKMWLINTQAAFICSMLIIFSSFSSYKKSINKKIKNGDNGRYKDEYDELEDPYNLFDEEINDDNTKKKKTGVVNYTIKGFASGIGGALNIYRLFSYVFLIIVFLYLNKHNLFNPIPFFIGLSVVPFASLASSISLKSKQS
jgi:hypothetical protein